MLRSLVEICGNVAWVNEWIYFSNLWNHGHLIFWRGFVNHEACCVRCESHGQEQNLHGPPDVTTEADERVADSSFAAHTVQPDTEGRWFGEFLWNWVVLTPSFVGSLSLDGIMGRNGKKSWGILGVSLFATTKLGDTLNVHAYAWLLFGVGVVCWMWREGFSFWWISMAERCFYSVSYEKHLSKGNDDMQCNPRYIHAEIS